MPGEFEVSEANDIPPHDSPWRYREGRPIYVGLPEDRAGALIGMAAAAFSGSLTGFFVGWLVFGFHNGIA